MQETDDGVARSPAGLQHLASPAASRARWSEEEAEATRLAALADVQRVWASALESIDVVAEGQGELDFQKLVSGLRKLLAAGLSAKELADALCLRYGNDAEEL